MTKAVWKYHVPFGDEAEVLMKKDAVILSAGTMYETPPGFAPDIFVWALVDIDAEDETRRFAIRGTGHTIDDGIGQYIATIIQGSILVWHLFERVA